MSGKGTSNRPSDNSALSQELPSDSGRSRDSGLDDHSIGYGKPPIETRFKPGQSGNPKGRPRRSSKLLKRIQDLFSEPVSIRMGNKLHRAPVIEVILRKQMEMALKGDRKALQDVFNNAKAFGALEGPKIIHPMNLTNLTDEDLEALERLLVKIVDTHVSE
jgi:hypothetical protein